MPDPIVHDSLCTPPRTGGVLLCALGFEKRSRFVAEKFSNQCPQRVAFAFDDRRVLSFDENKAWMEKNEFQLCPSDLSSIKSKISEIVAEFPSDEPLQILIDISSMTRPMIGTIVALLARQSRKIFADFVYAPAAFTPPSNSVPPQTYSGPVVPEYAGWTLDPSLPLTAIIGTGYEYGRALGILEYLEPAVAWIMNPTGVSEIYDGSLQHVNRHLFTLVPPAQTLSYSVVATFECFERIEAMVYGLKNKSRVLLCPFGPKIFALICLIVAEIHRPSVTVWRVSGGQSEQAADQVAAGEICRLPVDFGSGLADAGLIFA